MLSALFILSTTLAGLAVVRRFFPEMTPLARIVGGFVVGVVASGWATFLVAWGLDWATQSSLVIAMMVTITGSAMIIARLRPELDPQHYQLPGREILLLGGILLFSFWLMDARLSGDPLTTSLNTWGDNSYHISMLRSFSEGDNYPPQFPLFAGEGMRYHFGIDFYAGALERGGFPVEWSLNIPGAFGFAAIMVFVFEIGRLLFRSSWVGLVAVVLLITNGSLAFLRFFELYDNDVFEGLSHVWDHDRYLALGPYTLTGGPPDRISLYWTPNVFLTQTQLIIGLAAVFFVTYGLLLPLKQERPLLRTQALILGAVLGMMFWINGVVYIPAVGFMLVLLALFGRWREGVAFAVPAILIAAPQAVWLNGGFGGGSTDIHLGYLVCTTSLAKDCYPDFGLEEPGAYVEFVRYWWLNLGLVLPLLIVGMLWSERKERLVWLAVMSIFAFGNVVILGRDLGGHNHKVFNLWEILVNVFAAFAFVRLWNLVREDVHFRSIRFDRRVLNAMSRGAMPVIFLFLILSGILDFMVLRNDPRFDVFGDRIAPIHWIQDNTPRGSRFLTAYGETYTTPALAGRAVLWGGFEPWTMDKGYEVESRRSLIQQMYAATSKAQACQLLMDNDVDYVQIGSAERNGNKFPINLDLYAREFTQVYTAPLSDGEMTYYDVAASCAVSGDVTQTGAESADGPPF